MSLNEDLAAWVNTRPAWQKDAFAQLCSKDALSDKDVTEIAGKLLSGEYPAVPDIEAAAIPGATDTADAVHLTEVSEVEGVNALIPDQVLSFGHSGLTIAFGNNGSGKSGYARIIREAVTARVRSSHLLGDVFGQTSTPQSAQLAYRTGTKSLNWNLGDPQDTNLARVRFYDEDCGDAYVSMASTISYRPSALTILDKLSNACERLSKELVRQLNEGDAGRPKLPTLHPGTTAFNFVESLSATTTDQEVTEAIAVPANLGEELARYLGEEARLKGSDPTKEKARLIGIARNWAKLATHANTLETLLSVESMESLRQSRDHSLQLKEAARIASALTFESEPLPDVGSGTWRALWEAAREYSRAEAYHSHAYPFVGENAVCVLCQQPLTESAAQRLSNFEKFVSDTTARDSEAAAKQLSVRRETLRALAALPLDISAAIDRLSSEGEDAARALTRLEEATSASNSAVEWLDGLVEHTPAPIDASLSSWMTARERELASQADQLDAKTFAAVLQQTSDKVVEYEDAKALGEASVEISEEITWLAIRSRIEAARRQTTTNALTSKRGELTDKYVTEEVRDRFTRETERLELRRITLNRTGRGRSATLEHQPTLLGSLRDADVDQVLSEGEQTALGLAGFLTEVELDASRSAVVFDDPVSSLDAGRRSKVAKRLVELAGHRQVIVLTHEITFVHALNREAARQSVDVTMRSIQRMGDTKPGLITEALPWAVRDIPQRINKLSGDIARVKSGRGALSEEEYAERAAKIAGQLSETLERAVNLHVVNELVDRGTNEVRPRMLKILPKFSQTDHDEFQSSYERISGWAARHDNAPEENYVPPTPDELAAEVTWFNEWQARVKHYRD